MTIHDPQTKNLWQSAISATKLRFALAILGRDCIILANRAL
jgi:hypothetical protein